MPGEFPQQFDVGSKGVGSTQRETESWISGLKSVGADTSGGFGPADEDLIDGEIDFTGPNNAAGNVMHIFARLTDPDDHDVLPPGGATAELTLWVEPVGDPDHSYLREILTIDADEVARDWMLENMMPGTYRFGISSISGATRVEIGYADQN